MERSREARRSNLASANGLPRRRPRSNSLRDSHEEDGQMELQDTSRLRDRAQKRDRDRYRDREFSNHHNKIQSKRRRDSLTQENNREEGESTEESVADEEEYDIDDRRVNHINSHNTTPLFSSSLSSHNARKTLPPTRPLRQAPVLKATDEMIGVLVPRKARSVSVKRSHENWVSGNGGFWEDHRASTSTASRSAEANSPSSSNVSVRKKMKPNGPKTRLPKASKSSSSVQQDDIEIEIAEVLFGLMKQSQNSKNEDDNTLQKLESKDVKSISQESKQSVSALTQNNSPASDPLHAPKKNEVEADNCLNLGGNSSMASPAKLPGKMGNSFAPESQTNAESCEASQVLDAAKESMEPHEEVTKQGDSKSSIEGSGYSDGPVPQRNPVSDEKESSLCTKIGGDFQNSTVTKATWTVSESEGRKEEKFKIDLMAPPPMASSPDRDGFNDFASDPNLHNVNVKSVNDENVKESAVEKVEETIEPTGERRKMKFDLEMPNKDNGRETVIKLQNPSQKQPQLPSKFTIPKVEKSAQSSSVPLQHPVTGWANGLSNMGYMPAFQTIVSMDGSTRSATSQQPPQFVLSQPRPKRCATHHYIARNICLSQQLAKMNHFWPAGAGSASLHGGKLSNINVMPSSENSVHGNPLQGSLPVVNLSTMQDKGQTAASFPALTQKDKSSEGVNVMDPAQRKQLVLQQAPQPASTGNFLHAPAFIFPVSQQQAITGAANHSGPSKSATSNKSTSLSGNSTAALPASSTSPVPPVAAAVSYSYPNMTANEAPYMTILQNNGYPFPVPTPIGAPPTIRGTHSQALPFFNGSFYSSQFFHPQLQQQQQQPHSQPLIQAHPNTNTSSASSSSYKQPPDSQQPRGMPVTGSNILSSTSMQPQQPQKQHVPPSNQNRKLEAEMSGENTPSHADSGIAHSQTSMYGQNFSVPLQQLNFALLPSSAVSGGSSGGNHGEKQQQSHQKSLKGGVELIPPQAFAMSFASFTGNNTASNLSFSSMPQNPAIFQSQGYQVAPAAQAAQQKNHQISEMKTGGGSSNHDDSKKAGLGKSAPTNGQTLVFDNPARTLNFVSTPFTGNWPSRSITQTAITNNAQVASNSQNFHQNQLLQHQKQQTPQQSPSKAQTTNSQPSSSIAAKLANNGSIFPRTLVQSNSTSQSPQWKNSTRIPTSQVPPTSTMASSNTPSLKNVPQQQVRSPQGQTQISFERNSKSGLAPQGQQIPTRSQSPSPLVVGSPPNVGNLRTSSTGSKAGSSIPTLQSQQPENSSASTGQKSSPVCGRNVPSILSTCAGQLSELKY